MAIRLGINGFGRIGRAVLRLAQEDPNFDVVHLNDLTDVNHMAHLFHYDSVQGRYPGVVQTRNQTMILDGREIHCSQAKSPKEIPWDQTGCDLVLECTGHFRAREQCEGHLKGSVKKVILSAPGKDVDATFVVGVNHQTYDPKRHQIVSNASCTTNCLAPLVMVLDEKFEIQHGFMTTVHSYTNDQRVLDGPHPDLRRARAAALNQVPTTTGAAKAIALVLPHLQGKLEGMSIRVPTPNVSLVDLVVQVAKDATIEKVNGYFREASGGRLKGILDYIEAPLVSSDFNGTRVSASLDSLSTNVIGKRLVKVLAWYDNETGFSRRMLDLATQMAESLG